MITEMDITSNAKAASSGNVPEAVRVWTYTADDGQDPQEMEMLCRQYGWTFQTAVPPGEPISELELAVNRVKGGFFLLLLMWVYIMVRISFPSFMSAYPSHR